MDDALVQYQAGGMASTRAERGRNAHLDPKQEDASAGYKTAIIWGVAAATLAMCALIVANVALIGNEGIFVSNFTDDARDGRLDGMPWTRVLMWIVCAVIVLLGVLMVKGRLLAPMVKLTSMLAVVAVGGLLTMVLSTQVWPAWWDGYVSGRTAALVQQEIKQSHAAPAPVAPGSSTPSLPGVPDGVQEQLDQLQERSGATPRLTP